MKQSPSELNHPQFKKIKGFHVSTDADCVFSRIKGTGTKISYIRKASLAEKFDRKGPRKKSVRFKKRKMSYVIGHPDYYRDLCRLALGESKKPVDFPVLTEEGSSDFSDR